MWDEEVDLLAFDWSASGGLIVLCLLSISFSKAHGCSPEVRQALQMVFGHIPIGHIFQYIFMYLTVLFTTCKLHIFPNFCTRERVDFYFDFFNFIFS